MKMGQRLIYFGRAIRSCIKKLFGLFMHYTLGAFFWIYFKLFCHGKIEGEQNLESLKSSGFVLAANHSSYLDWVLLYLYFIFVHGIEVSFLAKDKVLKHRFWGPVVSKADCIRVINGKGLDLSSEGSKRLLEQDRIVIFPEGTRSATGELNPGKTGVTRIAVSRELPIIPTALCGFYEAWPRHRRFPRPHPLTIRFGEPINLETQETLDRTFLRTRTDAIMESIRRLKGEVV